MWCYVHAVLCTHCTRGVLYMWHCVYIAQVVSCTFDVVYMLCRWYYVQVVLCTCCIGGTSVHVVLFACRTCCVVYMQYYICALCSHGIMTSVFVVLYSVYVYILCCTLGVSVCMCCVVHRV